MCGRPDERVITAQGLIVSGTRPAPPCGAVPRKAKVAQESGFISAQVGRSGAPSRGCAERKTLNELCCYFKLSVFGRQLLEQTTPTLRDGMSIAHLVQSYVNAANPRL